MHPDWARGLRDQCTSASVPFFHKQNGQYAPVHGEPRAGDLWVSADGSTRPWTLGPGYLRYSNGDIHSIECCFTDSVVMRRARGKHDAGRELDGREWSEYPQAREVSGV